MVRQVRTVYAAGLRRRQPRPGDKWHLDEVFVTINGRRQYLWRAVDQDGNVLDILVQPRRDAKAAKRFFRKLLTKQCRLPRVLVTDKLRSYQVAHRAVMPSVEHRQSRYLEQPGGELAPADPATRTRHETLPHPRRSSTVPGGVQRDLPAFPAPPPSAHRRWLSHRDGRPLRHLERHHQVVGSRLNRATSTAPEPPSALFPLHLKQVDKAPSRFPCLWCYSAQEVVELVDTEFNARLDNPRKGRHLGAERISL